MKNSYKSSDQKSKKKILIVDDHPIVRQGLMQFINQEPDLHVFAEAENALEAIKKISNSRPDLAIIDISLQGMNGIELIKNIKSQFGNLPMLVLSMHDESLYAERALRAGAMGYIMKQEASNKVILAIRKVLTGEIYVSDKITSKLLKRCADGSSGIQTSVVDALSDRELEVFQMIGKGLRTRDIAKALHLSIKTVETYREHIKDKLKLNHATELVHSAVEWTQNEALRKT